MKMNRILIAAAVGVMSAGAAGAQDLAAGATTFAGIKNEDDAKSLWAYLKQYDADGKTK
jgi:hypothetical protein